MKFLTFLLIILLFPFKSLAAEITTQRDGDNLKITTETLGVPHKQLTYQGRNKAHLETGNKNLLANPGFEHQTITSGWTLNCTNDAVGIATPDSSAGRPAHFGSKTLNLEIMGMDTGGTCVFYQDVETGGAFDYMHSIWAKADTAGKAKVMFRKNEAFVTSNAQDVRPDWVEYKFQQVSGSTHSGIGIEITVGTGETVNVMLDEAVVGYNDPVSEVAQARVLGSAYWGTSSNCRWGEGTASSSTYSDYGADTDCPEPTVDGEAKAPVTKVPRVDFDSLDVGEYVVSVNFHFYQAGDSGCYFALTDENNNILAETYTDGGAVTSTASLVGKRKVASPVSNASFKVRYMRGTGVGTCEIWGDSMTKQGNSNIIVTYYPPKSKIISAGAELFSTDTHTLSFKSTAITSTDPVGTYNTYSYAANTNTKTICGTAPTTAPTKADGFKIFTRAYNAASTCGNPARVEIKIAEAGTSLPTVTPEIYKNDASASPRVVGSLDYMIRPTDSVATGMVVQGYDKTTGILVLDSGYNSDAATTSAIFRFTDNSSATSGYLVINAQPAKTTQAMDITDMAKSEGSGGVDIQSVYFGSGADCSAACTTGTCTICNKVGAQITSVDFQVTGAYLIKGINGFKYNCTGNSATGSIVGHDLIGSSSDQARIYTRNGSGTLSTAGGISVTCIGIP